MGDGKQLAGQSDTASRTYGARVAERAILDLLNAERQTDATVQLMPEEDGGCRFEVIHVEGKLLFSVVVARDGSVTTQEGEGL